MGNIAFTTLIVLLFAIPGYMVRRFYFLEEFSREVLRRSLTEEVYQSILYSLPFHFLTVMVIDGLYLSGMATSDSDGVTKAADSLNRYIIYIGIYFAWTAFVAMICGEVLRVVVWKNKLDVRLPSLFRYHNRWLYTFTGRDWHAPTDEYHHTVLLIDQ